MIPERLNTREWRPTYVFRLCCAIAQCRACLWARAPQRGGPVRAGFVYSREIDDHMNSFRMLPALTVAPAEATSAGGTASAKIVPGKSIAGVSTGDSQQAIEKRLGKPAHRGCLIPPNALICHPDQLQRGYAKRSSW